jgi:hypothetical protein
MDAKLTVLLVIFLNPQMYKTKKSESQMTRILWIYYLELNSKGSFDSVNIVQFFPCEQFYK